MKALIQIVKLGNDTFVLRVCLLSYRTAQKVSKAFHNPRGEPKTRKF